MVIEEDVGALDFLVLQDGLQTNRVGFQLFGCVQVVVPLVSMFVPPPLFEFPAMQSQIKESPSNRLEILADGILELGLVDKGGHGFKRLQRW